MTVAPTDPMEETMASKDKAGRAPKKVAARDLKQKRQDKKTKKEEAGRRSKSKGL
jgi:hypothetical protein